MRIAIDVRSLMEGGEGGVTRYTREIIQGMISVAPEHEYHLFYNSLKSVRLPQFEGDYAVHGWRYPNKLFKASQWLLDTPKWDRLLPNIDVVFVPGLGLMPLEAGTGLVSVVHDLSYEHFPELFTLKQRSWHKAVRPRRLIENSDAVIAVSEHTKRDLVGVYGADEDKIRVVHSGVVLEPGKALAVDLPEQFVLYFGTLEPRKNIDSIVRAYSAIADEVEHDLVIAGTPGWSMGGLDTALYESSFDDRIHLLGFVPEEKKAALYAAADVFVYPSLYEGFGFPPLEALLAGTPVIVSNNSALPEVVGQWAAMVEPFDVAELALVMRELLLDPPTVDEETKREIRETYSWERAARETLAVLESAC